ncbi:hypothetical protein HOLleu_13384 [Holothuria leucospilota]|uniref:Uncharacterized protein n=1 Tax=Holothuria leucospilota TaxID=206669 RepID=A0A9Q1CCX3_HOLLE|nr:hypothetical protein HOLleu_13384 [Holothuria leucospilota]
MRSRAYEAGEQQGSSRGAEEHAQWSTWSTGSTRDNTEGRGQMQLRNIGSISMHIWGNGSRGAYLVVCSGAEEHTQCSLRTRRAYVCEADEAREVRVITLGEGDRCCEARRADKHAHMGQWEQRSIPSGMLGVEEQRTEQRSLRRCIVCATHKLGSLDSSR